MRVLNKELEEEVGGEYDQNRLFEILKLKFCF